MEGENPLKLAPGIQADIETEEEDSDSEGETGLPVGTVYRIVKGQLKKLDGGMSQYEEIAARQAAKLAKGNK